MSERPELCRRTLRTKASVSASTLRVFAAGMKRGSCLHWWIYWVPQYAWRAVLFSMVRGGPRPRAGFWHGVVSRWLAYSEAA